MLHQMKNFSNCLSPTFIASQSNGMTFALHLTIALESTDFNTVQIWVAIFLKTSYVCSADILFSVSSRHTEQQEEERRRWRIVGIFKITFNRVLCL